MLLTDDEIINSINLDKERIYKAYGERLNTVDIYPALRKQLKKLYDWGNEPCPHNAIAWDRKDKNKVLYSTFNKRECLECWSELSRKSRRE